MEKEFRSIKFNSQVSLEARLTEMSLTTRQYNKLISESLLLSDKKRGMLIKGLVNISSDINSHNQILTTTRKLDNLSFRSEVIKAYYNADKKMELITGLSIMTKTDAIPFFKDFFDIGGTTSDVVKWLINISTVYISKKRSGKINADFDGWWDDAWDFVCDTVDTVGEAISSVVDAVIEAGKTFS